MLRLRWICSLVLGAFSVAAIDNHITYTCDSPIYCKGDLLHTVQMARIFSDSKTFVDMVTLYKKKGGMEQCPHQFYFCIAYIQARS